MTGLSWNWIAVMLMAPLPVAVLAAMPFWRATEMIFGNLAGTAVIFATAIGLIMRESLELDALARACLEAGYVCAPQPGAFMRYAIYAGIALVEVFALFTASLKVEARIRSRRYAPEWR